MAPIFWGGEVVTTSGMASNTHSLYLPPPPPSIGFKRLRKIALRVGKILTGAKYKTMYCRSA